MSSNPSNTSKLTWESSLLELSGKSSPSQSMLKLYEAGFTKLKDLLWILPLRVLPAPTLQAFSQMRDGTLFLGSCKLLSANFAPAYGRRGKGRAQLFNATLVVQDTLSGEIANLKFFNTYPNFRKTLESKETFTFMGPVQNYRGTLQVTNPKIDPKIEMAENGLLVEYPTVATVSGKHVKGIIDKIPEALWEMNPNIFVQSLQLPLKSKSLAHCFSLLHGKALGDAHSRDLAYQDLVYCEFFEDQLKILARRQGIKQKSAPLISWNELDFTELVGALPYKLTSDQEMVLKQIRDDFASGTPMMRMTQGDVGCGKTTVALLASLMTVKNAGQVALMCPTESLALQHFDTFTKQVPKGTNVGLLLGSNKASEKKAICASLANGEIDIIIGTHSLIQDGVKFKNLEFVIIDEQHKFGVDQRQRLSSKREGTHTLIMTATPIPRTLQLAQYGDLDISTIRVMPQGRAGTKTRIVSPATYEKYLSFVKTRLSMGEQVYIVAPAIEESETLDLKNVQAIEEVYKKYFPEFKIQSLHGKLKPAQKQEIFKDFSRQKIDLLISTSVIEVGINVTNATVMSIYNPDRFGLSSLHQLRGRVGRGEKPGFCFLVSDKKLPPESMARLKVIERSNDGFEIAEADLKNRGEGDLFGVSQSGSVTQRKVASIFEHFDIFDRVNRELPGIIEKQKDVADAILSELIKDQKVSSTI